LLWLPEAQALIKATLPLRVLMEDATVIVAAHIDGLDAKRPAMVLAVDATLKGKAGFTRAPVAILGDDEAHKEKQVPQLLRRLADKLGLVLFVNKTDSDYIVFAYTNGTWFQMVGSQTDDGPRWKVTHFEPYLRQSFKGTTAELHQVLADVIAGKRKPPTPDPKEKPGVGPEVEEPRPADDKKPGLVLAGPVPHLHPHHPTWHEGPMLAVIPSVLVAGPLAFLAMLFPAVFGGLILVLRRWTAALTVLSLNSTLYVVHELFIAGVSESWWATPLTLWLSMTGTTLLGLWWAWHRHLQSLSAPGASRTVPRHPDQAHFVTPGPAGAASKLLPPTSHSAAFQPPGIVELSVVAGATLLCFFFVLWFRPPSLTDLGLGGKTLWALTAGLAAATIHTAYRHWAPSSASTSPAQLPGEGVLLWAMTGAAAFFATTFAPPSTAPPADDSDNWRVLWQFRPPVERCWIASSPRSDGDHIYIAAVHPHAFRSGGGLYCLDRATGARAWSFTDEGKMKDAFSSPCIVDGRVYIGEGFHQHAHCKVYCIDAANGKKLWDFPTQSHTESSPCVAGGKVYCGAGDDGLYCLSAIDGKELWHFSGLHVDAPPVVVRGHVYGGSGIGDVYKDTMLFCLDADKGTEVWRVPMDLPVWGMPVIDGGKVFVGLGNGNFVESAERPAGALLCADASTGRRLWRQDVADSVVSRPVVQGDRVYFGARNGLAYALDRGDGTIKWKTDLKSPIVASPTLVGVGKKAHLYFATSEGKVVRLGPEDGTQIGTFDIAARTVQDVVLYSTPLAYESGDHVRLLIGCGLDSMSRGILYCVEDRTSQP
jgi:outer membrane protein assembly factor BamB